MEVGLAVGGAFLSAFLRVAFNRIASNRSFIAFFQGKKAIKLDEETLDKLERTLNSISVVLEDAESKQAKSPAVRRWIETLKDAVNQADDLLDEINTECLRLKVDYEIRSDKTKTDQRVSYKKLSLKSHCIKKLMPDLKKITHRLEDFVNQIHVLGLQKFDPKGTSEYRVSSSSVVDESQIFGRNEEREKLIQMVLSIEDGGPDVSVIPITGMGGVGKTTLAQLVYNDHKVKDQFPARAWVCFSEEYDAFTITKALLMEINSGVVEKEDDFNRLQIKLRDNLDGKRFLIVLDDIWNEKYNDWHNLKNPLNHGRRGSKIIITTRSEKIAKMMQNEPFHNMQPIPEDQSWSLFKSHAFDSGPRSSLNEFEAIGREIVKKCKGLPLAIKTIAGALRPKSDINEWHDILSSELWTTGTDILPSLSLSYKHLPSHLKSCFAMCSLFPKDISFDKDEVVLLWMANDLVQPSTHKSLKETGRDYFEDLRSRSLFEMVNKDMYLMHDLVNDFTQYVSGNFCVRLQDNKDTDIRQGVQRESDLPREVLHFSYLATDADTSRKFRELAEVHSLRTFLPIRRNSYQLLTTIFFSDILPSFRRIRVLNLSGYRIEVIPDSIGDLKHLRFINLANTLIRVLPNAITKCLNLQTLILANCYYLEDLPEDMRLLINLQHIDVRGAGNKLVVWLNMLTDIQKLFIVVDWIHGSVLEKLCKLQLCKSSKITGLEYGVTVEIAKKVELKKMNYIEDLTLEWSGIAECSQDELNIFSELQPHTNTKRLSIKGYRGTRFSDWLGDPAFINMESLSLQNCKNCFFLPPLGQLTRLKELHIFGMDGIIVVGEEFYGNDFTSKPFQALEKLSFSMMAEWAVWNTLPDNVEFPSLRSFRIADCPKLVGDFPFDVTSLKEIELRRCPGLVSIPDQLDRLTISDCPTLSLSLQSFVIKQLTVEKCNHLEFPTSHNLCLESLSIYSCGDFIEAIPLFFFSNLQKVFIWNWENPKLFEFPNSYRQAITSLQSLTIWNCNNILSFPTGGLPAPNLKEFRVFGCNKLKLLPEQMHTQLSSLRILLISECPEMECFPDMGLPPSLERLEILRCKKLMMFPRNWGLQSLSSLRELQIGELEDKLFPANDNCNSSLESLEINSCSGSTEPIPLSSFNKLQELEIRSWESPNIFKFPNGYHQSLTSLQSLKIFDCNNILSFPSGGIPAPNLKEFRVERCNKLKSLPEEMHTQLSSLRQLYIWDCPEMECFPDGGLPPSLERLHIQSCKKLMMFPRNWGLQSLPSLRELIVKEFEDKLFPEEGLLPASLQNLRIWNCPNLEALNHKGFQDITSLQYLYIWSCRKLRYLPEGGLVSFLSKLDIHNCRKLKERIEREKGKDWP